MITDDTTRRQTYEAGLSVRREVLGAEHVDRSLGQVTEFSRPILEWSGLVKVSTTTPYVWTR